MCLAKKASKDRPNLKPRGASATKPSTTTKSNVKPKVEVAKRDKLHQNPNPNNEVLNERKEDEEEKPFTEYSLLEEDQLKLWGTNNTTKTIEAKRKMQCSMTTVGTTEKKLRPLRPNSKSMPSNAHNMRSRVDEKKTRHANQMRKTDGDENNSIVGGNCERTEFLENAQLTKLMSNADIREVLGGQMHGTDNEDNSCRDTIDEIDSEMQDIVFSPLINPAPKEIPRQLCLALKTTVETTGDEREAFALV
ncbi:unnamed protein product [Caenorhabditis bovis]|uniref:Uncharacterized protein n=1 Tax=Caenorhabditis bovis TaxID=2654633 RepID=A0A8S1ETT8_9PELO|nr:unnamed protein product [Caenorhabditis bovis]